MNHSYIWNILCRHIRIVLKIGLNRLVKHVNVVIRSNSEANNSLSRNSDNVVNKSHSKVDTHVNFRQNKSLIHCLNSENGQSLYTKVVCNIDTMECINGRNVNRRNILLVYVDDGCLSEYSLVLFLFTYLIFLNHLRRELRSFYRI